MKIYRPIFLLLLFVVFTFTECNKISPMYDVVIKNGTLIDGAGTPTYTASSYIINFSNTY